MNEPLFEGPDYPELLEHLGTAVVETLVANGIHATLARDCGRAAAERVRRDFGGLQMYLPLGRVWQLTQRDREIYDAWNGGKHYVGLAQQYGISERHLRRIIEKCREEDRAKRQGQLEMG